MVEVKLTVFNSLANKVDKYYKALFKDRITDSREDMDEIDFILFMGLTTIRVHVHNRSIGEYNKYKNAQ